MKKTLACAALVGALGMAELPALDLSMVSFDAKLGYESEYVTHGRKEGQENVQLAVELGADIGGGHLYGGATSVVLFKDTNVTVPITATDPEYIAALEDGHSLAGKDVDAGYFAKDFSRTHSYSATNLSPYVGFTFGAGELIKADVGYVAHIYTNLSNYNPPLIAAAVPEDTPAVYATIKRNTNEIYGGVRLDVLCDPSIYAFYDIEREEFAFVGAGAYSWDLSPLGLNNINLEARATVGYDYAKRPYGGRLLNVSNPTYNDDSKAYCYYCFEAIAAYRYNNNVTLKARVSYSGNTAAGGSWVNAICGGEHKNCAWVGGAIEVGYR
jgi:hypothetical protein